MRTLIVTPLIYASSTPRAKYLKDILEQCLILISVLQGDNS